MPFGEIQHQQHAVESILRAFKGDAVPHGWLFHGIEGVGKELAAVALAQALVCEKGKGQGCGSCAACKRVGTRTHPDVVWLMPEAELVARKLAGRSDFDHTPSKDIRVEQVRDLCERLTLKPLEARFKVALIISAHAMNPQAQNALLKTLEEPPAQTVLVLVSSQPDKLLPTVRSRCAQLKFAPLPAAFIESYLKKEAGLDAATAKRVAAHSFGSLKTALSLDVDAVKAREALTAAFDALQPDDARPWLDFAETQAEDRARAEWALGVLFEHIHHRMTEPGPKKAHPTLDHPRALQSIAEARNAISARNGAVRVQFERLMLSMLGR